MSIQSSNQLHYGASLIPILQTIMKQKGNFCKRFSSNDRKIEMATVHAPEIALNT
jgi:hypothetical protein